MPGRSIRDEMQGIAPKPRVYGAPMGPAQAAPGAQRTVAAPAAPDVQRRAIAAHEAQAKQEARAGLYQKPVGSTATPAPSAAAPATAAPKPGVNVFKAAQTIQGRPAAIDQAVADAGG